MSTSALLRVPELAVAAAIAYFAFVSAAGAQSTLYYDRGDHPGWDEPDAWGDSDAGPFDSSWAQGSIAAFGAGGGFTFELSDGEISGGPYEVAGMVNTGSRVRFEGTGAVTIVWEMLGNPEIEGDFLFGGRNQVLGSYRITNGNVTHAASGGTSDPDPHTITIESGGLLNIGASGGNRVNDQTEIVVNAGGGATIDGRSSTALGDLTLNAGFFELGSNRGFGNVQNVSVTRLTGVAGTMLRSTVVDGNNPSTGVHSIFTVDQADNTEFAGDIDGLGSGPSGDNTMEMVLENTGHLTLSGTISNLVRLTNRGTGTLTVSGDNAYSGNTVAESGTTVAAHASALGTGQALITGNDEAVMRVAQGVEIGNDIFFSSTHPDSRLERVVADTGAFDTGTTGAFRSDFANGRRPTTAEFLGGTASEERTLSLSFSSTSAASNDALRVGDVFNLSGTGGDPFVLQLGLPDILPSESNSFLGWFDGDKWVNAIDGNSVLGDDAVLGFMGSFADSEASATPDYLGSYGLDLDNNVVWAILDHNSQFAVIPEPSASILLGGALMALLLLWHRRKTHFARAIR